MPSLSEYIKETFKSNFRVTQKKQKKNYFIQLCQIEPEPIMLLPAIHFYGFLLACIFTKSYLAFKNDATEILYSHVVKPAAASPSSNSTLNQARNGGRHYTSTGSDRNSEYPTGGTSTAPLCPCPSGSPGSAAERSPWAAEPLRSAVCPRAGAAGNTRLFEAGAREDAAGSRLGPASPGGPRAKLPPSPVRVLQDRLSRAGSFLREAHPGTSGLTGYPAGKRDKGKGEAFLKRSLS